MANAHPAIRIERDARAQFGQLWNALGLNKMEIQEPKFW